MGSSVIGWEGKVAQALVRLSSAERSFLELLCGFHGRQPLSLKTLAAYGEVDEAFIDRIVSDGLRNLRQPHCDHREDAQ